MFTMNVYNNQGDCIIIREYAEDRYELDAPGCPEIMGFSGDWEAVMHETGRYGYIFS